MSEELDYDDTLEDMSSSDSESTESLSSLEEDDLVSELDLSEKNDSEDEESEEDLNPDRCCYCGYYEPNSMAKCYECGKVFCNIAGRQGSHIIQHFVYSRHKGMCLLGQSKYGECLIECQFCPNHDVFHLGSIPNETGEQMVIICRGACLNHKALRELGWLDEKYTSLISDKAVVSWLIERTPKQGYKNTLSLDEIRALESLWKSKPAATLNDLVQGNKLELQKLRLTYVDALDYSNSFKPVLDVELEADKQLKEEDVLDNLAVTWQVKGNKALATFQIDFGDLRSRIVIGDELLLSCGGILHPQWSNKGYIKSIDEDRLTVEFKKGSPPPVSLRSSPFHMQVCFNAISYTRMFDAIRLFLNHAELISPYLYEMILGHQTSPQENIRTDVKIPKHFSAPNLPELNFSQIEAVKKALTSRLALIQGPPGTGKTVTSATLVYQLLQMDPNAKILVCAPSNIAVDHLTAKIHQTGVRVIRVAAKSRENLNSNVHSLCLHVLAPRLYGDNSQLYQLYQELITTGELSAQNIVKFKKLITTAEQFLLEKAQVICTTCSTSADSRLDGIKFTTVLIDEATQATEPETLIPIMHGCENVILVGDHQQLGPVIISKQAKAAHLDYSLFERLQILGIRPSPLTVQYRMHPLLSEFSSTFFYDGFLQNGVTQADRQRPHDFLWPRVGCPMMFWAIYGTEDQGNGGVSYLNRSEAQGVASILTSLLKNGIPGSNIGVITPYEAQRLYISRYLRQYGALSYDIYANIEIASVDSFQGREKDYIIFSCVRSNSLNSIGFLNDHRRLNVALTRAKYGIFILGNPNVLQYDSLWNSLLNFYQSHHCLVEGTFEHFRLYTAPFIKKQPFRNIQRLKIALEKQQLDISQGRENENILATLFNSGASDIINSSFIPNGLRFNPVVDGQLPVEDPNNNAENIAELEEEENTGYEEAIPLAEKKKESTDNNSLTATYEGLGL